MAPTLEKTTTNGDNAEYHELESAQMRILVGFDGSPSSHGALRLAALVSTSTGVRLRLMLIHKPARPTQSLPRPGLPLCLLHGIRSARAGRA
jgi:hypothetical protein